VSGKTSYVREGNATIVQLGVAVTFGAIAHHIAIVSSLSGFTKRATSRATGIPQGLQFNQANQENKKKEWGEIVFSFHFNHLLSLLSCWFSPA